MRIEDRFRGSFTLVRFTRVTPEPVKRLQEYWFSLCPSEGEIPAKSAFCPAKLPAHTLGYLAIVEYTPQGPQVRLSGTQVDAWFGQNMTGVYALAVPNAFGTVPLAEYYNRLKSGKFAGHMMRTIGHTVGDTVSAHTYYFPLTDSQGEVRYLVGMFYLQDDKVAPAFGGALLGNGSLARSRIHTLELSDLWSDETPIENLTNIFSHKNASEGWTNKVMIA